VKILTDLSLVDVVAVPRGNGFVNFISYLLDFWDYEKSEYIKERSPTATALPNSIAMNTPST
jgi:hypothetical protein